MNVLEYVIGNALILVPVLNLLGTMLKSTKKIKNNYIPVILGVLGIAGAIGLMGFSIDAVLQGILVTGAAVYGNQMFKQINECLICKSDKEITSPPPDDASENKSDTQ